MTDTLKPCPFCGSECFEYPIESPIRFRCSDELCVAAHYTSIHKWNHRKPGSGQSSEYCDDHKEDQREGCPHCLIEKMDDGLKDYAIESNRINCERAEKAENRIAELETLAYNPKGFLYSDCLEQVDAKIAELETERDLAVVWLSDERFQPEFKIHEAIKSLKVKTDKEQTQGEATKQS